MKWLLIGVALIFSVVFLFLPLFNVTLIVAGLVSILGIVLVSASIAARLTRAVRSDDVVGRVGGDEFACLLLGVKDRQHLSRLACKVYDTVSSPISIGDLLITIHPSIGISMFPGGGSTTESLLHGADMAMYRAKQEGKAGYRFATAIIG